MTIVVIPAMHADQKIKVKTRNQLFNGNGLKVRGGYPGGGAIRM